MIVSKAFERSPQKKALLVGMNYIGTNYTREGSFEAVDALHHIYKLKFHFDEVKVLKDATAGDILNSFIWLQENSVQGDVLVFHFCGKGTKNSIQSINLPITLNEINDNLLECIDYRTSLFCMFDCGELDLGFRFKMIDASSGSTDLVEYIDNSYALKECTPWITKYEEIEDVKISETQGTIVSILLKVEGISATRSFIYVLNNYYAHSLAFCDLINKLNSLVKANGYRNTCMLVTSKYVDPRVPFGTFISAPI